MPANLTPANKSAQPRTIMDHRPIWPWLVTHELSPREIAAERFVFTVEVEATRPGTSTAWQHALAGALAGLGGVS